ncbi:MAG: hypothetical protein WCW27_00180 [Patescibacteria group bacterium]|jgi:hypothetical protein
MSIYVHEIPGKTGSESGEIHNFPGFDKTRYVHYDKQVFPDQANALHCAQALVARFEQEKEKGTVHDLSGFAFYISGKALDKVNNPDGEGGFICIRHHSDKTKFYMEKLH